MRKMKRWIVKGALIASAVWGLSAAQALTMDEARAMATGESDARVEALAQAVAQGDDKTAAYLQALADDVVKIAKDQVLVVRDGQGTDPVTGQSVTVPADAEDVMLNNRLRGEIDTALAALKLFSADVKVRRLAALSLLKEPDASRKPLLEKRWRLKKMPLCKAWCARPVRLRCSTAMHRTTVCWPLVSWPTANSQRPCCCSTSAWLMSKSLRSRNKFRLRWPLCKKVCAGASA
jgi:hypothetical protein